MSYLESRCWSPHSNLKRIRGDRGIVAPRKQIQSFSGWRKLSRCRGSPQRGHGAGYFLAAHSPPLNHHMLAKRAAACYSLQRQCLSDRVEAEGKSATRWHLLSTGGYRGVA